MPSSRSGARASVSACAAAAGVGLKASFSDGVPAQKNFSASDTVLALNAPIADLQGAKHSF
eukprot:SAG31_NODE_6533_length_1986_cov_1.269210_3_plen_61_part_00